MRTKQKVQYQLSTEELKALNQSSGQFTKKVYPHCNVILGSYDFQRRFTLNRNEFPSNVYRVTFNYNFTIFNNDGVSINCNGIGEWRGLNCVECEWDHSKLVDSKELEFILEIEIAGIADGRTGKLQQIHWSKYGFAN